MNQKNPFDSHSYLDSGNLRLCSSLHHFTVTTINDRINSVDQRLTHLETRFDKRFTELETRFDERFTELETRFDKRFNLIETRLDALNQNYIDHLAHHIEK